MKNYIFTNNGFIFKRVNKATARACYNSGLTVHFCPVNLRPFNRYGFGLDMDMNKNDIGNDGSTFDNVLMYFEAYNCRDSETGKYTAFYIPVVYRDKFTGETDENALLYGHNNDNNVTCYNYDYIQ